MTQDQLPRSANPNDEGPWCWLNKAMLRRVTEHFADSERGGSARSLYLPFCQIASDEQIVTFEARGKKLADTAGLSRRTASALLPELEQIGAINIERRCLPGSKLKAPSIYTVLSIGNNCTSMSNASNGNSCLSIGKQCERGHLAENKKNTEETSEESRKSSSTSSAPLTPQPQAVGGVGQGKGALAPEEIWERTCRVLSGSLEKPISRPENGVLQGCALWLTEADMQMLEAEERDLSTSPNRRSQTAYSFLCHAATRLGRLKCRASTQPTSQAPVQLASPAQAKRPTVHDVFAYIAPGGWTLEVAQTYIRKRTRTDPPWHLPATNDRPARPIGADWQADVSCFLSNWIKAEAVSATESDDDIPY